MICYKDRTWCLRSEALQSGDCKNKACFRNYTKAEAERNARLVNLPLAIANMQDELCGYIGKKYDDG